MPQSRLALLLLALATLIPTSCQGPPLRIGTLTLLSETPIEGGLAVRLVYLVPLHNVGSTDVDGAWARAATAVPDVTITDPIVVFGPTPAGDTSFDSIVVRRPSHVTSFDPASIQWAIVAGVSDFDADGLPDGQEEDLGTAYDRVDSDGDGAGDGAEVLYYSDPTDAYFSEQPTHFPPTTFFALSARRNGEPAIALADPLYASGLTVLMGRPGPGIGGLAFDRHGFLYAGCGAELLRIHPLTGIVEHTLPLLYPTGAPVHVTRISFDPADGKLYGVANDPETGAPTTQLLRIDLVTGLAAPAGPALPVAPSQIAFAPTIEASGDGDDRHRFLYLLPEGPEGELAFRVVRFPDGASWTEPHGLGELSGIAFDQEGSLVVSQQSPFDWRVSGGSWINGFFSDPITSLAIPPGCPAPCFGEAEPHFETSASQVAMGDLDGDGDLDGVTAERDENAVGVLRNDGSGALARETAALFPSPVEQVLLGHFDGDAALDVVALTYDLPYLLRGDGNGGFGPAEEIPGNDSPLLAGDVTGDGSADLVSWSEVLENDGDGGFLPSIGWPVGLDYAPMALGQVDGSGPLEILAMARASALEAQAVVAFAADGAGGFVEVSRQELDFWPEGIRVADLDGDGLDDVLVYGQRPGNEPGLALLRATPGGLAAPEALPAPQDAWSVGALAIADVTGDGHADVVATGAGCAPLHVLIGDGAGGLHLALFRSEPWVCDSSLALADLDGDGLNDVLSSGHGLVVLPNRSPAPTN